MGVTKGRGKEKHAEVDAFMSLMSGSVADAELLPVAASQPLFPSERASCPTNRPHPSPLPPSQQGSCLAVSHPSLFFLSQQQRQVGYWERKRGLG